LLEEVAPRDAPALEATETVGTIDPPPNAAAVGLETGAALLSALPVVLESAALSRLSCAALMLPVPCGFEGAAALPLTTTAGLSEAAALAVACELAPLGWFCFCWFRFVFAFAIKLWAYA